MVCGSRPMSVPVFAANFARLTEQAVAHGASSCSRSKQFPTWWSASPWRREDRVSWVDASKGDVLFVRVRRLHARAIGGKSRLRLAPEKFSVRFDA